MNGPDLAMSLSWLLATVAAAGVAAGALDWLLPGRRSLAWPAELCGLACVAIAVGAWVARWIAAGHLPLFGTFESALSLAVAVMVSALAVRVRLSRAGAIWPVACGSVSVLILHGLRFDPTVYALTISERSWVVDVHAVLAWAAFGVLLVNAGLALRLLATRVDDAARLDGALAFSLSLGFVLHTAMLVSGSLYEFLLFGRAWSFDPVETLGFAAWIAYGALLHMHLFAGWTGRHLARWCAGLFLLLFVSYRAVVYFPAWSTYHIFDVDLRIHVMGADREAGR